MTVYRLCIILHVAAACLWLGHMFFWSLFAGPALKDLRPPERANRLRTLSLRMGGLGWPALIVLVATGVYMLVSSGVGVPVVSGSFSQAPGRSILLVKLVFVAGMILYQSVVGHRPAPRAIFLNLFAALVVIGASVMYVRG